MIEAAVTRQSQDLSEAYLGKDALKCFVIASWTFEILTALYSTACGSWVSLEFPEIEIAGRAWEMGLFSMPTTMHRCQSIGPRMVGKSWCRLRSASLDY